LQLQLAETTSSLNSALEQIGVKNAEISLLNEEINNLNSQLIIANSTVINTTYTEQLESQIVSLTTEKDKWKQLANSWYTVAMEQLRVMVQVLGL
jgi:inactivated superfamily I helicase